MVSRLQKTMKRTKRITTLTDRVNSTKGQRKAFFFYGSISFMLTMILFVCFINMRAMLEHHQSLEVEQDVSQLSTNFQNKNWANTTSNDKIERTRNINTIKTPKGITLPSAKVLLTQDPPYSLSQLIKLSDNLITSPNTVVTAYHRVPSKYKPGKYDEWMRNMLSLQDAMIVFTESSMVEQITKLRSHALNRTVIVPLELNDLPIGKLYPKEFWQDQLDRDPEKRTHRSYELFWIWLSKSWCVSQAIDMNIFKSDLFYWSDIGCFRDRSRNSKTMILHRDQIPKNEMLQMAHHKPNPPKENLFNDKYKHKANFYHSGSQFTGFKDTWIKFHEWFLETIDKFLERDMIIVEDQAVLQSVCLSHPEICAYVPFSQVNDNHYFGLRHVVHKGGNYKLWRHPNAGKNVAT